jgi:hypothetical protein
MVTDRVRAVDAAVAHPPTEAASGCRPCVDGFAVDWQLPPMANLP